METWLYKSSLEVIRLNHIAQLEVHPACWCFESGKGRFGLYDHLELPVFSPNDTIAKLRLDDCPDSTSNSSLVSSLVK